MARRIIKTGKPTQAYLDALEADLAAIKANTTDADASTAQGKGGVIVLPVDAALCVNCHLSERLIKVFNIIQPPLGNAEFFKIEETTSDTPDPPASSTTRNIRKQKSRIKKIDLSRVSRNLIKFPTDGLTTTPTRNYAGARQELKYISARLPRVLTRDAINHFITAAFGGGSSTSDRKLPSHFRYGGSNTRVDYMKILITELETYTV
ncbi:MAG: hypothetical protein F6K35_14950 [Okeania sp. SIO2H7]|nr:hypothetical protein [Okeania sp. SIO2H7]